jgi:hypothetical protein
MVKSTTSLLGASGEHFVMAELLRRDLIAALAPQGAPNMDIVVTDVTGESLCGVQVKTRRKLGADGGWHMRLKHENLVSDKLFYCFVDLGLNALDDPEYFVVPSKVVAKAIKGSHQVWLSNPGKNGHIRKDSSMRRFLPDYSNVFSPKKCPYPSGWLEKYRDAWALLLG